MTFVPQRVSPSLHSLHCVPAALQVWPDGQLLVINVPFGWQRRSVLPTHAGLAAQCPVESQTSRAPSAQRYTPGVHS